MNTQQDTAGGRLAPTSGSAWAISSDGENYGHLDFPTKEDAIAEGTALYDGEPFYVGTLEKPTPPEDLFDCADWLENVSCQDDYMGEHAEDWDGSTKKQREELNVEVRQVLAAWLDRHQLRPCFWNIGESERVEPNETSSATGGAQPTSKS